MSQGIYETPSGPRRRRTTEEEFDDFANDVEDTMEEDQVIGRMMDSDRERRQRQAERRRQQAPVYQVPDDSYETATGAGYGAHTGVSHNQYYTPTGNAVKANVAMPFVYPSGVRLGEKGKLEEEDEDRANKRHKEYRQFLMESYPLIAKIATEIGIPEDVVKTLTVRINGEGFVSIGFKLKGESAKAMVVKTPTKELMKLSHPNFLAHLAIKYVPYLIAAKDHVDKAAKK